MVSSPRTRRSTRGLVGCALILGLLDLGGCHRNEMPAAAATSSTPNSHAPDKGNHTRCDDLGFVPCQRQIVHVAIPIAGTSLSLIYSSDRVVGRKVDAASDARLIGLGGWSLNVLGSLDIATNILTTSEGRLRHVLPKSVQLGSGVLAVMEPDGRRIDVFDAQGEEVAVYDARTAARRLTFVWDAQGLKAGCRP